MPNKDLKKVIIEIISKLDKGAKVEVEEGETFKVNIDSEDSGRLIGRHGETLESLQYVLRNVANKIVGQRTPLVVDVAGYKQARVTELEELAKQVAENVKNSGYAQTLRPMNSYERRIVHVTLKEFEGVEVTSVGEEPYRCIEVKAKK